MNGMWKFIQWSGRAFTEGAPEYDPSTGRILSAVCTVAAIVWVSLLWKHSHVMPDVGTLGGLTAFMTAHYAANKLTGMMGR